MLAYKYVLRPVYPHCRDCEFDVERFPGLSFYSSTVVDGTTHTGHTRYTAAALAGVLHLNFSYHSPAAFFLTGIAQIICPPGQVRYSSSLTVKAINTFTYVV